MNQKYRAVKEDEIRSRDTRNRFRWPGGHLLLFMCLSKSHFRSSPPSPPPPTSLCVSELTGCATCVFLSFQKGREFSSGFREYVIRYLLLLQVFRQKWAERPPGSSCFQTIYEREKEMNSSAASDASPWKVHVSIRRWRERKASAADQETKSDGKWKEGYKELTCCVHFVQNYDTLLSKHISLCSFDQELQQSGNNFISWPFFRGRSLRSSVFLFQEKLHQKERRIALSLFWYQIREWKNMEMEMLSWREGSPPFSPRQVKNLIADSHAVLDFNESVFSILSILPLVWKKRLMTDDFTSA